LGFGDEYGRRWTDLKASLGRDKDGARVIGI
jgi:hypothetical protein